MERNLKILIKRALDRECEDDHLDNEERLDLVNLYLKENPTIELPEDLTEAYLKVIGL